MARRWFLSIVFALNAGLAAGQPVGAADSSTTAINAPAAIMNWQCCLTGVGESPRFLLEAGVSELIDRAMELYPTQMLGVLHPHGRTDLIQPGNVAYRPVAPMDSTGLVQSLFSIRDPDFVIAQQYFNAAAYDRSIRIPLPPPAPGDIWLVGPRTEHHGLTRTPGGDIVLAPGGWVDLVNPSAPSIRVVVQAGARELNLRHVIEHSRRMGIYAGLARPRPKPNASAAVLGPDGRITFTAAREETATAIAAAPSVTLFAETGEVFAYAAFPFSPMGPLATLAPSRRDAPPAMLVASIALDGPGGFGSARMDAAFATAREPVIEVAAVAAAVVPAPAPVAVAAAVPPAEPVHIAAVARAPAASIDRTSRQEEAIVAVEVTAAPVAVAAIVTLPPPAIRRAEPAMIATAERVEPIAVAAVERIAVALPEPKTAAPLRAVEIPEVRMVPPVALAAVVTLPAVTPPVELAPGPAVRNTLVAEAPPAAASPVEIVSALPPRVAVVRQIIAAAPPVITLAPVVIAAAPMIIDAPPAIAESPPVAVAAASPVIAVARTVIASPPPEIVAEAPAVAALAPQIIAMAPVVAVPAPQIVAAAPAVVALAPAAAMETQPAADSAPRVRLASATAGNVLWAVGPADKREYANLAGGRPLIVMR
jgi:hypothetical protein